MFNYYNEKEILIEPERKFKIDEVIPPINNIIRIRCDMEDNDLVLNDNVLKLNYEIDLDDLDHYDYLFKYILVGDACSGKTNFMSKFINSDFDLEFKSKVGVEFGTKVLKIRNKVVKLYIWNTAGEERYKSIISSYYKGSACAILLYNIKIRTSFENIPNWIEEIQKYCPQNIYKVLVGINIESDNKREVSYEEGKILADKYGILFYESSCLIGENIDEIFCGPINEIIEKLEDRNNTKGSITFENEQKEQTKISDKKEKQCIII